MCSTLTKFKQFKFYSWEPHTFQHNLYALNIAVSKLSRRCLGVLQYTHQGASKCLTFLRETQWYLASLRYLDVVHSFETIFGLVPLEDTVSLQSWAEWKSVWNRKWGRLCPIWFQGLEVPISNWFTKNDTNICIWVS